MIQFDPTNEIIQLCTEGMGAEAQGKPAVASRLFQLAWDSATNDFEAFTAAHYMARAQKDPEENLRWNSEALERALKVEDEGMNAHYPSLYLNIAKSHEDLSNYEEATHYYRLAASYSKYLPETPYGEMIKTGISRGLQRTGAKNPDLAALDKLIENWCARKELTPLSFVLPAYLANTGAQSDRIKLCSALSYLHATRCLNRGDQHKVTLLINELSLTTPN